MSNIKINLKDIIRNDIINHLKLMGVQSLPVIKIDKLVSDELAKLKQIFKEELWRYNLKAADTFNKEFIVREQDYPYIYEHLDTLIELRLNNPNIPIENLLLISNIQFCVLHKGGPKIIDMPVDIYKFLVKNKYEDEVFNIVLNTGFIFNYNYVTIIKAILKVGKSFKEKVQLLGDDNSSKNILEYIRNKFYSDNFMRIQENLIYKLGNNEYKRLSEQCETLDISAEEFVYRVGKLGIAVEEAIKIGEIERDKYKIYNDINKTKFKEVFYAVVREHIRSNNQ